MQKAAPLIISSESNLAEEHVTVETTKRSQQNKTGEATANESAQCTRKRYQNNAYEVTIRGVVAHPDMFLSKVLTTVAGRRRDAQTIEVPGTYTLLR